MNDENFYTLVLTANLVTYFMLEKSQQEYVAGTTIKMEHVKTANMILMLVNSVALGTILFKKIKE